jgi:hypothetical protein
MSNHPRLLLQQKIYELLAADTGSSPAGVSTLVTARIFDFVPDNSAFPFVTIGEMRPGEWGSHTGDGIDGTVVLHVFSQSAGRKEVMTVMNRIYQVLHNIDLQITGFPTICFREESSEVILDPDGKTHHGVLQYRCILGGN